MRSVAYDRAFERRTRIEPASAARQHDAERHERRHVIGRGGQDALEAGDRIVEAAVIAQERGVVETRVKRCRVGGDRALEIGERILARGEGRPAP
jgi:hypothetical protein